MLFNSWVFLAFMPLVFCIYWFVCNRSLRLQNAFLAIASFIFYGWWSITFLLLLLLSLFVDFFVGYFLQKTEKESGRKILFILSLVFNIGLLSIFKYFNFFAESLKSFLQIFGLHADFVTLHVILPVGISFYTFQSLSYTIQVYRRKMQATTDIITYAAYISFFPQLVAGPIEKAIHFLPQFQQKRNFNYTESIKGMRLILWGFFKKVVIADTCALYANDAFNNFHQYHGTILILGAIYFSFQIYGDFSGYTDIARGLAKLLGFDLIVNFKYPYFSRNIAEFWRRWHISLTSWFRDYLFIPLGGSKVNMLKTIRNISIVFLISGLWHGANFTFIVWGALHALYYIPLILLKKTKTFSANTVAAETFLPSSKEIILMLFNFFLVTVAWVFFRSNNCMDAFHYFERMMMFKGFSFTGKSDAFILVLFLICIDWIGRHNENTLDVLIHQFPKWRYFIYVSLGLMILANFSKQAQFIYFQF